MVIYYLTPSTLDTTKQSCNFCIIGLTGVRYKEVDTRQHKGKPDSYFLIRYGREGQTINEGVGFKSEGIDAKYASAERAEIVKNIRLGTCWSLPT